MERHGVFRGDLSVPALTPSGVASLTPSVPRIYLVICLSVGRGQPFFFLHYVSALFVHLKPIFHLASGGIPLLVPFAD